MVRVDREVAFLCPVGLGFWMDFRNERQFGEESYIRSHRGRVRSAVSVEENRGSGFGDDIWKEGLLILGFEI